MPRPRLIRTTNNVETPAAGVWLLGAGPSVTVGRGRAGDVAGALVIGEAPLDVRIVIWMVARDGAPIEITANLIDSDSTGWWTLDGRARVGHRAVTVTVDAQYHGVFRNGAHAWAELRLHTSLGRRMAVDADVIFDAPLAITQHAA